MTGFLFLSCCLNAAVMHRYTTDQFPSSLFIFSHVQYMHFSLFVAQGDTVYATVVPELDERELEKTINPIVQEYFEHGDTKEVEVSGS